MRMRVGITTCLTKNKNRNLFEKIGITTCLTVFAKGLIFRVPLEAPALCHVLSCSASEVSLYAEQGPTFFSPPETLSCSVHWRRSTLTTSLPSSSSCSPLL